MRPKSFAGSLLYAVAQYFVDVPALRQVVEPTLADLQHELREAGAGRLARTRVLLSGHVAFWKVVSLHLVMGRCSMDLRLVMRMAGIALCALFCYVLALQVLPFAMMSIFPPAPRSAWILYATVQGLASMMPFAVFAAVLWSARGSSAEGHPKRARSYAVLIGGAFLVAGAVTIWAVPPLVAALEHARHGTTVIVPWPAMIFPSIRTAAACVIFAFLGVALAPYARRITTFVLAVVLIPLCLLLANALTAHYLARNALRSPVAVLLPTLALHVLVLCVALGMIAARRRVRGAPA